MEEDHLDYFKDINDIKDCFSDFAKIPPEAGFVIANFDDDDVKDVVKDAEAKVV